MRNHGWYPPGQVSYPPELPNYFKNVYDLKPIVGVPNDDEVIGVHAVIHAANSVSGVPEMHDRNLFMKLADHLFNAQMARYRSKYSLITFPSDATYTPPALPAQISVHLEPVCGSPSDDEIMKVQDAVQAYQGLRRYPPMFDAHVNMELSQHLFDVQMARHMRVAGETPSTPMPQLTESPEYPAQAAKRNFNIAEESTNATNNTGTGASAAGVDQTPQLPPSIDVGQLMERSNQLAERFNQLLERTNELMDRCNQPSDPSNTVAERFNQVFERFTQYVEQARQPPEPSDRLTERFNQLFERFNQLVEQSTQPAHRANELAERSNELADKANQLTEKLNRASERSNVLAEQASKSVEKLGDLMKNINRVLMGIQHAIVRNHKGNTLYAVDCLVNEKGQTPKEEIGHTFGWKHDNTPSETKYHLPVRISGNCHTSRLNEYWLGPYLCFYGIGEGIRESPVSVALKAGGKGDARKMLSDYLSSCLG
ncbi:unnamed protein product [Rhizoctonia solani]|uniref:Laminin domain protein n=1 Tax=Rhizoctonia solani TaxID=456999 RepID=A0A8H3AGB7_9AGAM|nr:unnamed protein product [Rhizoctonia solani]